MTIIGVRGMRTLAVGLAVGTIACGCGIFTPRDAEPPLVPGSIDPLSFAQILTNSHSDESFGKLDYEDLFHDSMTYVDAIDQLFDKQRLRGRLNTIVAKYPDIEARWELADTSEREPSTLDQGGIVTLNTRRYRVYRGAMTVAGTDTTYELDYRGEASIKLKYRPDKEAWTIYYWRDSPLGVEDKSFFHPDFAG